MSKDYHGNQRPNMPIKHTHTHTHTHNTQHTTRKLNFAVKNGPEPLSSQHKRVAAESRSQCCIVGSAQEIVPSSGIPGDQQFGAGTSQTRTHSLTHSLTHSFTHPPTHPLTHSLTHSLIHPQDFSRKNSFRFVPHLLLISLPVCVCVCVYVCVRADR